MDIDLIDLPWKIQLTLAVGYGSYVIAYTGVREFHRATDVIFKTAFFTLIATLMFYWGDSCVSGNLKCVPVRHPAIHNTLLAVIVPLIAALLWRRIGIQIFLNILRALQITTSDDTPSAWYALTHAKDLKFTQLSVVLADDSTLMCNSMSRFSDMPDGPCSFGPNGDLALYVTDIKPKYGPSRPQSSVISEFDKGAKITYVPKEQIKRVLIRRKH